MAGFILSDPHYPRKANETTLRSRSLVFIALGIYAAKRLGDETPLYTPENGLIALNIPLTPGRSGSCSTRTMHPFYLEQLRLNLQELGITNPIINHFEFQTKGECVVNCQNAELLKSIMNDSVSCSHATRRQNWIRKSKSHCGYCIPCIIRRAAIHKAGFDNGIDYGFDICEGELTIEESIESANDLRAIIDFISKKYTAKDLTRFIRLVANDPEIKEHSELAYRGFNEIKSLFMDKGNEELKNILN